MQDNTKPPAGLKKLDTLETVNLVIRVLDRQSQRRGLMGLFDGILGGVVGGEMATVVNGLIEKHGGVQGIVAQMESQGLGNTVKSWVGNWRQSADLC